MPYEPTVWQDHVTEYPGEYQIKKTSRGTYNIVPVGKVIQEGTPQNAKNFNKIEDALCTLYGLSTPLEINAFNGIEEMQAYSFDKNKLYHFFVSAQVGALLGGEGYCFGRYTETTDPETDEVVTRMIEVLNSSTLMVWMLNLTEGTAELKTGVSNGIDGKSAYEIAVDNGFKGTEAEWLESLKGADGESITDYWKYSSHLIGDCDDLNEMIGEKPDYDKIYRFKFTNGSLYETNPELANTGLCLGWLTDSNNSVVLFFKSLSTNRIYTFKYGTTTNNGNAIECLDISLYNQVHYKSSRLESVLQEIGTLLETLNAEELNALYAELSALNWEDVVAMNIKQSALATECGGLLANIRDNIIMSCSVKNSSGPDWTDKGIKSGTVFINWRYGTNYQLQIEINQSNGMWISRIVNRKNSSIYRGWRTADGMPLVNILALGDSICRGVRNSNKGFVGDLGFPYKNIGVSSATISNVTTSVTNIPDQLVNLKTDEPDYVPDIIIAEGGINDWSQGAALGNMFDSSGNPITQEEVSMLNRSTVIGGLEYLFYKMITLYPNAQRFFLITHKTYKTSTGAYCPTAANSEGWTQQDLHDAIEKCCKVYNVKVIDVYEESMINSLYSQYRSEVAYNEDNSVTDTQYVDADGVHPLAYGYKQGYVPLIRQAIRIGTDT